MAMRVGTVREIKNHEYRVGLTVARKRARTGPRMATRCGSRPAPATASARRRGLSRRRSGDPWATPGEVFAGCEMIVKVKEPQPAERAMLREGQILFTYLHLAPDPDQTSDC
jgi:alanine dehydrogenase